MRNGGSQLFGYDCPALYDTKSIYQLVEVKST